VETATLGAGSLDQAETRQHSRANRLTPAREIVTREKTFSRTFHTLRQLLASPTPWAHIRDDD
jgi:hypothetical protein